jgi:hypothetical protein
MEAVVLVAVIVMMKLTCFPLPPVSAAYSLAYSSP